MSHPWRKPVVVTFLDRERELFFDMAAWARIKEAFGVNWMAAEQEQLKGLIENLSQEQHMLKLLHIGLLRHEPKLTLEALPDLFCPGDYTSIARAVAQAIANSLRSSEQADLPDEPPADPTLLPPPSSRVV